MTVMREKSGYRIPDSSSLVRSILKAAEVLECFTPAEPRLTLSEISERVKKPKSSTLNLLRTLEQAGLVSRVTESGHYQLSIKMMEYAYNVRANLPIVQYAMPFLEEIQGLAGENVYLTTHVGGRVFYLECLYPTVRTGSYSVQGKTLPMHCTGVGKAMLSALPDDDVDLIIDLHGLPRLTPNTIVEKDLLKQELREVRLRGYALDHEEESLGVKCVAVPIRNKAGYGVGAISISGTVISIPPSKIERYAEILSRVANTLSDVASYFPVQPPRKMI